MKNRKKIATLAYSLVPFAVFADPLTLEGIVNAFSVQLLALLGGVIPGLVLTIKFAFEMIRTYSTREQNPEAFKFAIIKFSFAVFAIINLALITIFVFGDNAKIKSFADAY